MYRLFLLLVVVVIASGARDEEERVSFLEKQLQELRNEMKEDTKEIGRQKRQAEECLTDQYWDGRKCELCSCPAGQQLRAFFCGRGILLGSSGCQDCPPFTYRRRDDNNQTCHRCSSCSDPDAYEETSCSFDTDTVCRCREGFVMRESHCASCRDHPHFTGCPSVPMLSTLNPDVSPEPQVPVLTTLNPDGSPEPSPELHTCNEKPGYSSGVLAGSCIGCIVATILVTVCIVHYGKERSLPFQNRSSRQPEK